MSNIYICSDLRKKIDSRNDSQIKNAYGSNIRMEALIELGDESISVYTELITKLEFFQNILSDIELEVRENKPVIFSLSNDNPIRTFCNKNSFELLFHCLALEPDQVTASTISPVLQADYICLLDYLTTKTESQALMKRITFDFNCFDYLMEDARIFARVDQLLGEAITLKFYLEWVKTRLENPDILTNEEMLHKSLKRFGFIGGTLIHGVGLESPLTKYALDSRENVIYDIMNWEIPRTRLTLIILHNKRPVPNDIIYRSYYCEQCLSKTASNISKGQFYHACTICREITVQYVLNQDIPIATNYNICVYQGLSFGTGSGQSVVFDLIRSSKR